MVRSSSFSPNRILKSPPLRTLLSSAILLLLALEYGHTHFFRDPGSMFYDPAHAFDRQYSDVRLRQARAWLEDVETRYGMNGTHEEDVTLEMEEKAVVAAGVEKRVCAEFITIKREEAGYIEDALASTLSHLTSPERADLHLSLFFANTDPTIHPTFHLPWLRPYLDAVYTHDSTSSSFPHIEQLESSGQFREKGVVDYIRALEHCYATNAPWTVLFEDDVLLAEGWFVRVVKGVEELEKRRKEGMEREWLFMRLFNQERSTGWGSKEVGGNNELWISAGIWLVVLPLAFVLRRVAVLRPHVDWASVGVLCLLVVPTFVVLFFQAGKASLLPPRPGFREENFGCCSQGLVFPREQIPGLVEFLTRKKEGQVDMLLKERALEAGLARMALYPVQLQHVGTKSVRGTTNIEAQSIWSMAFEGTDARRLSEEHKRLVKSVYSVDNIEYPLNP